MTPSQEGGLAMAARALDLRGGTSPEDRDARSRAHAAYAVASTSADGGLTWAPMTLDPQLPNYYVKGFFAMDGGAA
ncbi:sialidase family protein [Nonomuraea sp. NPDC003804]|uniref:sialidase family protein n=1 Tax=Nonomuraea sp. NPDC003804 TaxID=3154547 RepID=UPI00339FE9E5